MKHVKDILTKDVAYVGPDKNIVYVATLMEENQCGFIPVAENEKLIGMITDRDIVLRCVKEGKDPAKTPAKDVMTPKVLYCYDDDTVEEAAENMGKNQVRRLPVINREKKLVGVVSLGDLSREYNDDTMCGKAMDKIAA